MTQGRKLTAVTFTVIALAGLAALLIPEAHVAPSVGRPASTQAGDVPPETPRPEVGLQAAGVALSADRPLAEENWITPIRELFDLTPSKRLELINEFQDGRQITGDLSAFLLATVSDHTQDLVARNNALNALLMQADLHPQLEEAMLRMLTDPAEGEGWKDYLLQHCYSLVPRAVDPARLLEVVRSLALASHSSTAGTAVVTAHRLERDRGIPLSWLNNAVLQLASSAEVGNQTTGAALIGDRCLTAGEPVLQRLAKAENTVVKNAAMASLRSLAILSPPVAHATQQN